MLDLIHVSDEIASALEEERAVVALGDTLCLDWVSRPEAFLSAFTSAGGADRAFGRTARPSGRR